jgi:hypothetical protein
MRNKPLILVLFIALLAPSALSAKAAQVHHDITITLYPEEGRFEAEDSVSLPNGSGTEQGFLLHEGLEPAVLTKGVGLSYESQVHGDVPLGFYKVRLPEGKRTFTIRYGGRIHHPLGAEAKEQARGFSETPGIISAEGVYLAGSSYWYPKLEGEFVTFALEALMPRGWGLVTQGKRTLSTVRNDRALVRWESLRPQEEIYLVASRFTEYTKSVDGLDAMVFLREPDEELAAEYLDATIRYIWMYEKLIGPYPYGKFALVENFWETGYGMPSFTLLGPKIIRFPFIIKSSYPHEILHSWWGNSVYPYYGRGNWSEGLTAYLSDHLMKEMDGRGAGHRQTTLQKYADYVLRERDFPLVKFRARHSTSSEAVGYGKSMMFFHMLRLELGDEAFVAGLGDFYRRNRFGVASFEDLRESLERVSHIDLGEMFEQWLKRTGAPRLELVSVKSRETAAGFVLTANMRQTHLGSPYTLRIPIAVTLEGKREAFQSEVVMDTKEHTLVQILPQKPLRLDLDPEFDVFRRLDRKEVPPALSQAFGAREMLVLLPAEADEEQLGAYEKFAEALRNSGPDRVEVKSDGEVTALPSDRAVTVLGRENKYYHYALHALAEYDIELGEESVRIGRTEFPIKGHSVVLAGRNPSNPDVAVMLIDTGAREALPALARKLPHYHKYSYLGFEGPEAENVAKGRWPVLRSPMTAFVPDARGEVEEVERGGLAKREPLATLPPLFSKKMMMETVSHLSGSEIEGRGFGAGGLDRAAEYIEQKFREAGLEPMGDEEDSYMQSWEETGGKGGKTAVLKNVLGMIPGANPGFEGESVVVAAHYDHLGWGWPDVRKGNEGKLHPGADDNASGVAVLVELARVLSETLRPGRSIIFAAFTGEEWGRTGSHRYVEGETLYPAEKCIAMLNLDSVGRLGDGKLLVIGASTAKEWVHIFRGAGYMAGVEIETVKERLDTSDNVSFEDAGVPAVQLFSGPHLDYHRPDDTAEKVDPDGLLKVAVVSKEALEYLAKREGPLTKVDAVPAERHDHKPGEGRKVSIGTVPDFAFKGKGYRLSGVAPGSPAEAAGLREGDVIVRIGPTEVRGLRDLSDVLKALEPGALLSVTFLRNGEETTVELEAAER